MNRLVFFWPLFSVFLFQTPLSLRARFFEIDSDSIDSNQDETSNRMEEGNDVFVNQLLYLTNKQAKQNPKWSNINLNRVLGDVSGLAATKDFLYVLHRANVTWNQNSFSKDHIYQFQNDPISVDTVVAIDLENGDIMFSWAKNRFFLPHGISVDEKGNVWVTDVALHQVCRYKSTDFEKADLVLGERFVPGNDATHFCKPTDVAVASTGVSFIADGYCNSRIMVFNEQGRYLTQFGENDQLLVPHSLALLESQRLICVADRENGRVLCYTMHQTASKAAILTFILDNPQMHKIYAIAHLGDIIMALNGGPESSQGISVDVATEQVVDWWHPTNGSFFNAHDLTVTPDQKSFFVCQLGQTEKIIKFDFQDYPLMSSDQ